MIERAVFFREHEFESHWTNVFTTLAAYNKVLIYFVAREFCKIRNGL